MGFQAKEAICAATVSYYVAVLFTTLSFTRAKVLIFARLLSFKDAIFVSYVGSATGQGALDARRCNGTRCVGCATLNIDPWPEIARLSKVSTKPVRQA